MEKTYQNFRNLANLINPASEKETLSDIAVKYQQTQSPALLAHIFCKLYPYLKTQADKYFYLTSEDKVSFIVEEIHKAVLAYKPEGGAWVQTLISVYINNRLRSETGVLQHQKRCVNNTATSYEEVVDVLSEVTCGSCIETTALNVVLNDPNLALSDSEKLYCRIVMAETHILKDTDVARLMGKTPAGVGYIKRKLGDKLSCVLA